MNRREESEEGEAWDGATWVDVGDDDRWHPSVAERTRAFVLLGVLLGFLLLAAAIASLGGGDDDPVATPETTTTTTEPPETTTTRPLPSSLDGEPPPDECLDDDRRAMPLRGRDEVSVRVLNGARVNGLAGHTSGDLDARGYTTSAGDAPATETTALTYADGYCAEAVRLADDLDVPDADVTSGAPTDGVQIEIVLGRDEFLE